MMKNLKNQPRFVTHFERAAELGVAPEEVKIAALKQELGDYESSGGVIYLPTAGGDMSFFDELMEVKWGLAGNTG